MARVQIFLSTVSAEFGSYRDRLRRDLTRPNVSVTVQEDFIVTGTETLDMLDDYIRQCDAVIHLVGHMTGAPAQPPSVAVIRQRYPDLGEKLPPLAAFLQPDAPTLSYTQWEAWLALYHGKPLIIAAPEESAPRDERYELIPDQRTAQQAHLQRLAGVERYPFRFANADRLAVEVLRSKLQEILAQAGPPTRADPNLCTLLTTVKRDWIEGVLANSLHGIVQLEIGKQSYTRAIDYPWKEVIVLEDQSVQPLPSNARIIDIYRKEAGNFLLILGEPGSGKTITLLELASDLIAAAEIDPSKPVPVVLNLSTWKESHSSLSSWIIEELKSKYFVGERLSKNWLRNSRLLLMLDGLDEVQSSARAHCVNAINAFLEESTPGGMVVSCRFTEYEDLPIRLRFKGAIKLLPLTTDQIDQYLAATSLDALRTAVQFDASLMELAQSPLVLNIMALAYKDDVASDLLIEKDVTRDERYKNLMNRYIEKMFNRKAKAKQLYARDKVVHGLSWLAQHLIERSQTVFLIESLQPDWLAGRAAWAAYWIATRITWAAVAVMGVMLLLLPHGAVTDMIQSVVTEPIATYLGFFVICIIIAGVTGLVDGQLYGNGHMAQHSRGKKRFWFRWLHYGGSYGLMTLICFMVAWIFSVPSSIKNMILSLLLGCALYVSPITSFRSIKRDVHGDIIIKAFGWSWKRAEQGFLCTIAGFMIVVGVEIPIIVWQLNEPILSIASFGTVIIVLVWPFLRSRVREDAVTPISFLAKIGMSNYMSAIGRLVIFVLAEGLIILVGYTLLKGWSNLPIEKVGILPVAFVGIVGTFIYFGILVASFSGIKATAIETSAVPNQGITLTLRHAVITSMRVFLTGTLLICVPLFTWSHWRAPDMMTLAIVYQVAWAVIAMAAGLWYGVAVMRHFVLRFILYRQGHLPLDLANFLDYATKLIFLQKVGGGYVFIHRLVMEHFANLGPAASKVSSAVGITTNK